jgi:hypothetical protein
VLDGGPVASRFKEHFLSGSGDDGPVLNGFGPRAFGVDRVGLDKDVAKTAGFRFLRALSLLFML